MEIEALQEFVVDQLEDMKAKDIVTIDVRGKTSITDLMFIATGTSSQHAHAIASKLIEEAKKADIQILSKEGERGSDWILVDLTDAVVHIMLEDAREFYQLEKLWSVDSASEDSDSKAS